MRAASLTVEGMSVCTLVVAMVWDWVWCVRDAFVGYKRDLMGTVANLVQYL
jgi:hypothetical protein